MSKKTPSDPAAAFRDLVTQWERGFNSMANSMMGTGTFSSWMNQMQSAQLAQQKAYREFMARQLADANIPTRDEVMRVAEAVRNLDSRLERIEQSLAILAQAQQEAPAMPAYQGPPRTRKPKVAETKVVEAAPTNAGQPAPTHEPTPSYEPAPVQQEEAPAQQEIPVEPSPRPGTPEPAPTIGEPGVVTTTPETFVQYADQVADQFQGVAV